MILLSLLYSLQLLFNLGWCGMKLEKDKIVRYLKRGLVLVGIGFGTYISWGIINVMLSMSDGWIGFWGSIFGSIIGGLVTYIVVRIQIKNDNQNLKKQIDNDKEKELEKERREVMPVIDIENISMIEVGKIEDRDKSYFMRFRLIEGIYERESKCINLKFSIQYKNIGNGIAFESKFRKGIITGFYDNNAMLIDEAYGMGTKSEIISKDTVKEAYFEFELHIKKEIWEYNLMNLNMEVNFKDLLGNEYTETIWFDIDLKEKSIKYKFIEEINLTIKKDNYKKLKEGMTIEKVEMLVGKPSSVQNDGKVMRYSYIKTYDNIHMVIKFLNGKVVKVLDAYAENNDEEEKEKVRGLIENVKLKLIKIKSNFKRKS